MSDERQPPGSSEPDVLSEQGKERRTFLKGVSAGSLALFALSALKFSNVRAGRGGPIKSGPCPPSNMASQMLMNELNGQGMNEDSCLTLPLGPGKIIAHLFKNPFDNNMVGAVYDILNGAEAQAAAHVFKVTDWATFNGSFDMYYFYKGSIEKEAGDINAMMNVVTFPDPMNPSENPRTLVNGCAGCISCSLCAGCLADGPIPDFEGAGLAGIANISSLIGSRSAAW